MGMHEIFPFFLFFLFYFIIIDDDFLSKSEMGFFGQWINNGFGRVQKLKPFFFCVFCFLISWPFVFG
jgi:hypothetical protein